ncbi:MAG: hypothetical protein AMXMBFR48_25070 [Ignavibacteriales bacterium]
MNFYNNSKENTNMNSNSVVKYSDDLVTNPTSRIACTLLLDISGSMSGDPIDALNDGLKRFVKDVKADDFAAYAVDLAIVTFGGSVQVHTPFQNMSSVTVEELYAGGGTPMGEAVEVAMDLLEERKDEYKRNGVSYYRPWMFLMTDGQPTDSYVNQAQALKKANILKQVVTFGIGIGDGCDFNTLAKFCPDERPPVKLADINFRDFFLWLSQSLRQVSSSVPGTKLALPPTDGWTIDL